MGHVVFLVLHLLAFIFIWPGLLVTVPAHLIYAAVKGRQPKGRSAADEPNARTHVRCPECRELVRMDATRCKHCSAPLVPQQPEPMKFYEDSQAHAAIAIAIGLLVLFVWLAHH